MRALILFSFFLFSTLFSSSFDVKTENKIRKKIRSEEYFNELFEYHYEGEKYPLLVIYNPKNEPLWSSTSLFDFPIDTSFILITSTPSPLASHLETFAAQLSEGKSQFFSTKETPINLIPLLDGLHPVYIAKRIDDPHNDKLIAELFCSTDLQNRVFYYHLGNEYFRVRAIHNPEELYFNLTKTVQLAGEKEPQLYTTEWEVIYGLVSDKQAPQELFDHLAELTGTSTWNWYVNFEVMNGTQIEYYPGWFDLSVYNLGTWYECLENLKLEEPISK